MKMKLNVQLIIIAAFVLFAAIGFILFSRASNSAGKDVANVVVWGTIPSQIMNTFASNVSNKTLIVQYVQKNSATFERDLLEALAAGTGPDLFIVSQDDALKYQKFVFQIPYQSYSKRAYQNTFIEEANIFATDQGLIALPLMVDPLVMYYNRTLLASAFITTPPEFWDEIVPFVPKVTRRSPAGAIAQSGIALGTFDNVANAKEILATFMLQAGNRIVGRNTTTGNLESIMLQSTSGISNPADSAVRYYTSFADATKENYTWNSSLNNSTNAFVAGDVALYIGYASELTGLRQQNPNLNFDVTLIPQTRNSGIKATYGRLQGIAVSKGSKNINAAIIAAGALTNKDSVTAISQQVGLPPVRKDLLALAPTDASYTQVFYNSAIISQGWLDPDTALTKDLFKQLIDSVNARLVDTFQAVQRASVDIDGLLGQYNIEQTIQ